MSIEKDLNPIQTCWMVKQLTKMTPNGLKILDNDYESNTDSYLTTQAQKSLEKVYAIYLLDGRNQLTTCCIDDQTALKKIHKAKLLDNMNRQYDLM